MSVITRMRRQSAIWWEATSSEPDRYGKFSYETPVLVSCRWDDSASVALLPDGTEFTTRSIVYVGSEDTKPGDYLKKSDDIDDVTDAAVPQNNENAYRILAVDKNPNFKATETLVTAKF